MMIIEGLVWLIGGGVGAWLGYLALNQDQIITNSGAITMVFSVVFGPIGLIIGSMLWFFCYLDGHGGDTFIQLGDRRKKDQG